METSNISWTDRPNPFNQVNEKIENRPILSGSTHELSGPRGNFDFGDTCFLKTSNSQLESNAFIVHRGIGNELNPSMG